MRKDITAYDFSKIFGPLTPIIIKNHGEKDQDLRKWSDRDLYSKTIVHADIEYVAGQLVIAATVSTEDATPALFPG